MSKALTEEDVNRISDLFEACELLEKFDLDLDGVTTIEDAKCRLLRHVQELAGNNPGLAINVSAWVFCCC